MTDPRKCKRCGESTRNTKGFCSWCKQIEDAILEVHEVDEWREFANQAGYQPLGPEGGRIFTKHGDPGNPSSKKND